MEITKQRLILAAGVALTARIVWAWGYLSGWYDHVDRTLPRLL